MSFWTYVRGQIVVSPMGRTQHEKEYILKTVLDHLPLVTGSEDDMRIYTTQIDKCDVSSTHDEFGMMTDKAIGYYGCRNRHGMFRRSSKYIVNIYGSLRDRYFEDTQKEVVKWLCRLSKRCTVDDIIVKVSGYSNRTGRRKKWIETNANHYREMCEEASWLDEDSVNWCEYLMWNTAKYSSVPLAHSHKYRWNDEDSEEFIRRKKYECSE